MQSKNFWQLNDNAPSVENETSSSRTAISATGQTSPSTAPNLSTEVSSSISIWIWIYPDVIRRPRNGVIKIKNLDSKDLPNHLRVSRIRIKLSQFLRFTPPLDKAKDTMAK